MKYLGCNVLDNYEYSVETSIRTCADSQYINWLNNDQTWWISSVVAVENVGVNYVFL